MLWWGLLWGLDSTLRGKTEQKPSERAAPRHFCINHLRPLLFLRTRGRGLKSCRARQFLQGVRFKRYDPLSSSGDFGEGVNFSAERGGR